MGVRNVGLRGAIYQMPVKHLGHAPLVYTVLVYRKCTTGEGVFMFDTKEPDAIFEQVQRASHAMARHRSNDVSSFLSSVI